MNWLLSDEFIEFSKKISDIHSKKKALKAELKEFYDKVSSQIKTLDKEAVILNDEFEAWKNNHAEEKVEKTDAGE